MLQAFLEPRWKDHICEKIWILIKENSRNLIIRILLPLMLSMLGKTFSRQHFEIFFYCSYFFSFYFFFQNQLRMSQLAWNTKPYFRKKKTKKTTTMKKKNNKFVSCSICPTKDICSLILACCRPKLSGFCLFVLRFYSPVNTMESLWDQFT